MIVSKEWIAEKFSRFNADYFGGLLPTPAFGLSRSKSRLGSMSYRLNRRLFRTVKSNYTLHMTTAFDMTERQAENILLHEMIHLHIASQGLRDTSSHGKIFRSIMQNLNRQYGWEITVSTSPDNFLPAKRQTKKKMRLVLLLRHQQAGCIISVVNAKYRQQIERVIARAHDICEHQWIVSDDDYFASFPQVRSLRGRRVSEAEYQKWWALSEEAPTSGLLF